MSVHSEPPPGATPIPESLRAQLADFRWQLWRRKAGEAALAGVIGFAVSFLLVYALDRLWPTPAWLRFSLLLAGASLSAVFAPYWLHRWLWRHRREAQLARLIARRFPGLGDRLLGVIELQNQREHAATLSPRLRAAAMEAVAAEAAGRDLAAAQPPDHHRSLRFAAFACLGAAAAALVITPRAGSNALRRWLLPFSDTPRYTFTQLDQPPDELVVPYGESFGITLHLAAASERRPATATGRFAQQPPVTAGRTGDSFRFEFPGQQEPGVIEFHLGDARHATRVTPVQRPAIESATARIQPPAYLGLPEQSADLASGRLTVVEGSRVTLFLNSSRPLRDARFGPTAALADASGAIPAGFTPAEGTLTPDGRALATPPLEAGAASFEVPFAWTDGHGLSGGDFKPRILSVKDAAPAAYLQGIDRQKAILPEETLDFELLAEDDFGVKACGLEWQGTLTRPGPDAPARGELTLARGGPGQRRSGGPLAFSPGALGIAPQQLTLRAWAEDDFPGRGRVYSEPVTLYVLTRDEHAQMLKSRFDRAIGELEDIARRERNHHEENQRLERLDGSELQSNDARDRLGVQQQAEADNTRRMDDLARRMEQLLQDSARNGDIDKDTLKKMAQTLKSLQELSRDDLPGVDRKLGEAQEPTNTPDKSRQDLRDAVAAQQQAIEKMQKAIDQANDANRRMEAGTFANRLKKAAAEEEGIAGALLAAAARLYGLPPSELDPVDQRLLSETAHQQADTASDIRWLQEDLGHYFARTGEETFQRIFQEMRDSKIDLGLEDVRSRLRLNHSSSATGGIPNQAGAKEWAEKLAAWAKRLADEQNAGGGGGAGGGGASSEDQDFEFMLRVMKMVQQEQDLRSRTRALEQYRRTFEPPAVP